MKRWLLVTGLALATVACNRHDAGPVAAKPAAAAVVAPPTTAPAAAHPMPARPSLSVKTLDGAMFDLAAHRGKWVVVNYWATWCGPCLKEMPELSALDAMRDQIDVVGLAYDDIKPAELRAFLQQHPVVYPIAIVDTYAPPADFAAPEGLPMSYLIAPDGTVAKRFMGPVTAAQIDAEIAAASHPKAG